MLAVAQPGRNLEYPADLSAGTVRLHNRRAGREYAHCTCYSIFSSAARKKCAATVPSRVSSRCGRVICGSVISYLVFKMSRPKQTTILNFIQNPKRQKVNEHKVSDSEAEMSDKAEADQDQLPAAPAQAPAEDAPASATTAAMPTVPVPRPPGPLTPDRWTRWQIEGSQASRLFC